MDLFGHSYDFTTSSNRRFSWSAVPSCCSYSSPFIKTLNNLRHNTTINVV
jgi:hypothetical protein